jgi:hypothetical protein
MTSSIACRQHLLVSKDGKLIAAQQAVHANPYPDPVCLVSFSFLIDSNNCSG